MEKTFPTRGKVHVFVENGVGLVAVTGGDGDGTRVSLEANTPDGAEFVEGAVVECHSRGERDHVIVKIPRLHGMKFVRRNSVTVRIEAPAGSDVTATTASAHVELNGSIGAAHVKTASGDITADDVEDLKVKTASGDIEVGTVEGELRMQTASGDLRCVRAEGRASVSTASGDVEIGSAADRVDVRGASGDIRLGDVAGDVSIMAVSGDVHVLSIARGRVHVRSISGQVDVGVAQGVALSVDAESTSGTVHSDIPLGDVPVDGRGDPPVALTLRSVSGNILVTRGAGAFTR
jgi:DUF4097 and DUF4098 domain-containing protein YvlB